MSAPPAPPLLLASSSPQRRAILEQLGLPFEVVEPVYEERGDDPLDAYRRVRKPVPPPGKVIPDQRRKIREEQAERERRRPEGE